MKNAATTATRSRSDELKQMLEGRLYELTRDVHGRMRELRLDSLDKRRVIDQGETSELDTQDELEFAMIRMKADTLNRIATALRRIEEGTYGRCFECGDEIGQARLRALPFAVRCKDCEDTRELAEQRERTVAQRHTVAAPLFD